MAEKFESEKFESEKFESEKFESQKQQRGPQCVRFNVNNPPFVTHSLRVIAFTPSTRCNPVGVLRPAGAAPTRRPSPRVWQTSYSKSIDVGAFVPRSLRTAPA